MTFMTIGITGSGERLGAKVTQVMFIEAQTKDKTINIFLNITQIWISIIEQAHLSEMDNGKTKHVAQDVAHS